MWTDLSPVLLIELQKPENADIFEELTDQEYIRRQHYSRATYALGCHGPLCRRAERDRGRRRNEIRALTEGREYTPGENRKADREALLDFIIAWHVTHPDEITRRREARTSDKTEKEEAKSA